MSCCSMRTTTRTTARGNHTTATAAMHERVPSASNLPRRGAGISSSIWEVVPAESKLPDRSWRFGDHEGTLAAKKKTDEQVVRIAPLGELRAYTISEHELEKLE